MAASLGGSTCVCGPMVVSNTAERLATVVDRQLYVLSSLVAMWITGALPAKHRLAIAAGVLMCHMLMSWLDSHGWIALQ